MESCRPAIMVSFGVTAPCGPYGLQGSRNRFQAEFRGLRPRFETPRSAPSKRGLSGGDFHFSDTPLTAEVCLLGGPANWLCLVLFQNYSEPDATTTSI